MGLSSANRLGVLIVIGGGLAGLPAAMPVLEAQAPAPAARPTAAVAARSEASVTVTGCLLLGPYGDYTLSKTIAATGEVLNTVAWTLEGHHGLLGHVLEKVEVTGTMRRTPSDDVVTAAGVRPADRNLATSYRLRVETIKKVVGGCS